MRTQLIQKFKSLSFSKNPIIFISIYMVFLIVLEAYIAFPTTTIRDSVTVQTETTLSYTMDPYFFGGNTPQVLSGQKIIIKIFASQEIMVNLVQTDYRGNQKLYFQNLNLTNIERSIQIESYGDIDLNIFTKNSGVTHMNIEVTRMGLPTPIQHIILVYLIMIGCYYFIQRIRRKEFENGKTLVKSVESISSYEEFRIYLTYFKYHTKAVGLIIPVILLLIEPQMSPFSDILFSRLNENQINFTQNSLLLDQTKYFSGFLIVSCLRVILYAIPISLLNFILEDSQNRTLNEKTYPINSLSFNFARSVAFTGYIVVIPILDMILRLYLTIYYNTAQPQLSSVLFAILINISIVFFLISLYFLIFENVESRPIRLIIPVIIAFYLLGSQPTYYATLPAFDVMMRFTTIVQLVILFFMYIFLGIIGTLMTNRLSNKFKRFIDKLKNRKISESEFC